MAKIRTLEKEATLIAESNGHGLFLWQRHLARDEERPRVETVCAKCGEPIAIVGRKKAPDVAGAPNCRCPGKVAS